MVKLDAVKLLNIRVMERYSSTVQSIGVAMGLASQGVAFIMDYFHFVAVITFVSGSVFLMWLGEQVTEKVLVTASAF